MTPAGAKIELKRVIRAPREKVFQAWTQAELLARWIGPGTSEVLESTLDVKIGGSFRLRMKGDMKGMAYDVAIGGVYQKIIPNTLLSFTWAFEDEERKKTVGHSLVTVSLKEVPGGTELTLIHERIATPERREGHTQGWISCLDKLEKLLS